MMEISIDLLQHSNFQVSKLFINVPLHMSRVSGTTWSHWDPGSRVPLFRYAKKVLIKTHRLSKKKDVLVVFVFQEPSNIIFCLIKIVLKTISNAIFNMKKVDFRLIVIGQVNYKQHNFFLISLKETVLAHFQSLFRGSNRSCFVLGKWRQIHEGECMK